ncbi:S8 family peptidase [Pollutimonas harenae]|uniref:S8 family serine peptidase n=1 Tax=Pollutimonas harenae TaxID=657015 RepID=A0A853H5B0_9BURK|nr:S8 family serine peptidase [Pollutimonas harenae]NYT86365.1 S8 family serine peptidase [Pollutimonas harenae]TEA69877.1 protease [Pollutimonas harenae]
MPLNKHKVTGRYLVLLCEGRTQEGVTKLIDIAGLSLARAPSRRSKTGKSGVLTAQCAIVFNSIGVALIRCTLDKQPLLDRAMAESGGAILAIEPERRVYATGRRQVSVPTPVQPGSKSETIFGDALLQTYLKGYRDAVDDLAGRLGAVPRQPGEPRPGAAVDESLSTWGIQATKAVLSQYSGTGVRLAVLDTGLDLQHPDFSSHSITSRSFVDGQTVQDGNGHGTHCAGIACGPVQPSAAPRYGVASSVQLYVGKVLSDEGSGDDGGVLEGINWAVENQCQIISMSLGSPVQPGQGYSKVFEEAARRALKAGTVVIAAAGNDSQRDTLIAPVSHPANCPSIMAVAAIDKHMQIAPFSSGGLEGDGGQVDVAGPGVDILSSWPGPEHYRSLSGTSMATPFVAGVAALLAEADGGISGHVLLSRIVQSTLRLALPSRDVGAGLIQAPHEEKVAL